MKKVIYPLKGDKAIISADNNFRMQKMSKQRLLSIMSNASADVIIKRRRQIKE